MVDLGKRSSTILAATGVASVVASIAFLVFNSRPSADEYLMAPVIHGFYVDAPERKLFQESKNIFLDYLQGVQAVVSLGWDSYGNAATFQMIPAVIANYFGPLASTLLAIIVHIVIVLVALAFASNLLKSNLDRTLLVSIFVLSLFLGVIVGDYQTELPFGIFPLTGIRFSSYLIQPLMLSLIIFMFVKELVDGGFDRRKLSFLMIAFPLFVSLWTTMYLLLLIPIVLVVTKFRGKLRTGAMSHWAKIYTAVVSLAAFNASFVVFPKVDAGRSASESLSSTDTLSESVITHLLSEKAGIYFSGLWPTILSTHSGIGFIAGFLLSVLLGKRLALTESSYIFTLSFFAFTLGLPFVFAFQELITYQAFWHRTAPITYSFVLFFFIGLIASKKLLLMDQKRSVQLGVIALSLFMTVGFVEMTNVREKVVSAGESLVNFRQNWDTGDPFGVGTSIENVAPYSILNFMQISPYRHPTWVPPEEILEDVVVEIEPAFLQETGSAGNDLVIRANSSYFSKELKEKVFIEFEIVDKSFGTMGRRSISGVNVQDSALSLRTTQSSRGLVISGEIPLNKSTSLELNGDCKVYKEISAHPCYEVIGLQPGFSHEFKKYWKITSSSH